MGPVPSIEGQAGLRTVSSPPGVGDPRMRSSRSQSDGGRIHLEVTTPGALHMRAHLLASP